MFHNYDNYKRYDIYVMGVPEVRERSRRNIWKTLETIMTEFFKMNVKHQTANLGSSWDTKKVNAYTHKIPKKTKKQNKTFFT